LRGARKRQGTLVYIGGFKKEERAKGRFPISTALYIGRGRAVLLKKEGVLALIARLGNAARKEDERNIKIYRRIVG